MFCDILTNTAAPRMWPPQRKSLSVVFIAVFARPGSVRRRVSSWARASFGDSFTSGTTGSRFVTSRRNSDTPTHAFSHIRSRACLENAHLQFGDLSTRLVVLNGF